MVIFFYVCQAWVLAIGCKSRMHFAVRSISQEQGCPSWDGIWRKLEANVWADEQKLFTGGMVRVMLHKKQKPDYCADYHNVEAAATWTESEYSYPERSDNKLAMACANVKAATGVRTQFNDTLVLSEVSRSHSTPKNRGKGWMLERQGSHKYCRCGQEAETRKRTTYPRIGRNPKVKDKRCLTAGTRKRIRAMS
jgi:hypothetical protein